jgi:hypothetical protein
MVNCGGEDEDWEEGSGDEEEREEGDDDLIVVESSGSRDYMKPILRLPERNEEDTVWTRSDGTKPVSAKHKLKSEDMATIRKRKDLMWTEVGKNDQDSLVDRWLRDQIKPATWDKIDQVFPHQRKCSSQQKWVLMTEDTKSLVPIRYQQYGITVKLTPDKHDKTHTTVGTLPKTINSASKRAVLAFLHLNADLWTSKVSHQKFLVVRIFWKSDPGWGAQ